MAETMTPSETAGITAGQIAKINENLAAALRKSGLQKDPVQKVLEDDGDQMIAEMVSAVRRRVEALLVPIPRGTVTVTLAELHDPDKYYQTREGLYVWGDFRERIISKAKPVKAGATYSVSYADVGRDSTDKTDKEIEAALPTDHLFDESSVCAVVAGLIATQPNG